MFDLDGYNFSPKNKVTDIYDYNKASSILEKEGNQIFVNNGFPIDIYTSGLENSYQKKILVIFSGAISKRENKSAPFFSGKNIAKTLDLPLIAISDPTLALSKSLSLSWYAGNEYFNNIPVIINNFLKNIQNRYDTELILVGGSGGGFAVLDQLSLFGKPAKKVKALIWSPQTNILNYHLNYLQQYIFVSFPSDIKAMRHVKDYRDLKLSDCKYILQKHRIRYDISKFKINDAIDLLYLQNVSDDHVDKHAKPFIEGCNKLVNSDKLAITNKTSNLNVLLGSWGEGHAVPPMHLILLALDLISTSSSSNSVKKLIEVYPIYFPTIANKIGFKGIFDYSFDTKNNGLEISYRVTDNDASIAAYIYLYNKGSDRVVVHKIGYHKVLDNYHIPLVSGRYQIKFFVRKKGDAKYSDSLLTQLIDLKVLWNYLPLLHQINLTKETITLLADNGLNKIDFDTIVAEKHKSGSGSSEFFNVLSETSLSILSKNICTYDTAKFLFNCIFYTAGKDFLVLYKEQITFLLLHDNFNQSKKDILFWFGLMEYKIGYKSVTHQAFSKLLSYKNELEFHQTGSIAYLDDISVFDNVQVESCNLHVFNNSHSDSIEGCLLISCDYGYYLAYVKEKLINISNGVLVHLHFVITLESEIYKITKELKGMLNVNYSYELVGSEVGNLKTYYSIARYMILDQVIRRYKLPTLVADADLDFDLINLLDVFRSVKSNDIILRKTSSDLPWLRVLAGFNVFGYNTFDSSFLIYLKKYLTYCIYNERDGWMLDQVALSQCLYFCEDKKFALNEDTSFLDCEEFLTVNIKQVANRQQKREAILSSKAV